MVFQSGETLVPATHSPAAATTTLNCMARGGMLCQYVLRAKTSDLELPTHLSASRTGRNCSQVETHRVPAAAASRRPQTPSIEPSHRTTCSSSWSPASSICFFEAASEPTTFADCEAGEQSMDQMVPRPWWLAGWRRANETGVAGMACLICLLSVHIMINTKSATSYPIATNVTHVEPLPSLRFR
jgi:hypothetical protein